MTVTRRDLFKGFGAALTLELANCAGQNGPISSASNAPKLDAARRLVSPPEGAVQKVNQIDHNVSGPATFTYGKSDGLNIDINGDKWAVGMYRNLGGGKQAKEFIDNIDQIVAGPDGTVVTATFSVPRDNSDGDNRGINVEAIYTRLGNFAVDVGGQKIECLAIHENYRPTGESYNRTWYLPHNEDGHVIAAPVRIVVDKSADVGLHNNLRSISETTSFTGINFLPAGAPVPEASTPAQRTAASQASNSRAASPMHSQPASASASASAAPNTESSALDKLGRAINPYINVFGR